MILANQHRVDLGETTVPEAMKELVEDELAEIIRAYKKAGTEQKPCKITVSITVSPDERGDQLGFAVSASSTRPSKKPHFETVIAGVDKEGKPAVKAVQPGLGF